MSQWLRHHRLLPNPSSIPATGSKKFIASSPLKITIRLVNAAPQIPSLATLQVTSPRMINSKISIPPMVSSRRST